MSHHSLKSGYQNLVERLNRFPQGAPPSELLYKILKMLFNEQEAQLVSLLPIKPFTAEQASQIWNKPLAESQKVLDELASRAILLDIKQRKKAYYVLPPPMAGFFEFSLMRVGGHLDQKILSELYYQYLTVEEDFIKALFTDGETQLGRVFVHEPVLPKENTLEVLDYERASHIIKSARYIGVGTCYCRHKMSHLGKACDAPLDICLTFGGTADSLTRHGYARKVDATECMDLLQKAYDNNLVQFGENVQKGVSFICNCCGCCCEALLTAKRFGFLNPIHTTKYLPVIQADSCNGCGKCIKTCPVNAIDAIPDDSPSSKTHKKAQINEALCLGCGLCTRVCPQQGIQLKPRSQRVITPINSVHRITLMAIERGKLQNLIYDNQVLFSHRAMAAILGVILRLPPIKQAMASKQLQSRYLVKLIQHYS